MAWSANHNCIFNSYRYALGTGLLKGINYNTLKVNITDSNFYSANYYRMKGRYNEFATEEEKALDYNKIRLGHLKGVYKWNVYDDNGKLVATKGLSSMIVTTQVTLNSTILDTFNKDTGQTSETYYEQMLNIPASAKIFTNNSNNGSWITNDLDWTPYVPSNQNTLNYFAAEYNFNQDYNKTEYQSYGLELNKLDENVCRLSADSFVLNERKAVNKQSMDWGAAGVLLTYENEELGLTGKNELPVAYYEFGKTLHSNYNFLQIDWHEDGVIKVE